jgi:peptide/nickel transport system ATP-binding protein
MALLEVKDLKMYFKLQKGVVRAVDEISFELERCETLGIVGESGCGKSSLGMALMGVLPPNGYYAGGQVLLDGMDLVSLPESELRRVRWSKISMIFQAAMNALNPVLPIRDQLIEALRTHERMSEEEADGRVREMFGIVGLPESRIDSYSHEFSGGMRQRAIIAMSLICRPVIIIADEPTTALDVVVQDQILDEIKALQKRFETAIVFISHDISVLAERCDRIAIMYAGKLIETADSVSVFKYPHHPYTMGLLRSIPSIRGKMGELRSLPGVPPSLVNPPAGCRYAPRCPYSRKICGEQEPQSEIVGPGHLSSCHFASEIVQGRHKPNPDWRAEE